MIQMDDIKVEIIGSQKVIEVLCQFFLYVRCQL